MERIAVEDLGAVIHRLHAERFGPVEIVDEASLRCFLAEAAGKAGLNVDPDFLFDEWTLVVDAWNVPDAETYRDLPRLGRKLRMAASRRDALWAVFAEVRARLAKDGLATESGCAHALRQDGRFPFTHVIVDEAQDISVAELMLLGCALGDRANGLFFAGDIGSAFSARRSPGRPPGSRCGAGPGTSRSTIGRPTRSASGATCYCPRRWSRPMAPRQVGWA